MAVGDPPGVEQPLGLLHAGLLSFVSRPARSRVLHVRCMLRPNRNQSCRAQDPHNTYNLQLTAEMLQKMLLLLVHKAVILGNFSKNNLVS